jgi:hypothetical protein
MEKIGSAPTIGGIPIKKESMRDMIEIENIDSLENDLKSIAKKDYRKTVIDISLLQLADGIISETPGAEHIIDERFSSYTQNERGNDVVKRINETMQYLENYRQFLGLNTEGELHNSGRFAVPGIMFTGDLQNGIKEGYLKMDVAFIRRQEAMYKKK